jgi:hypothetical protein
VAGKKSKQANMKYLRLDLRALAIMRMAIAAVIMFDLGIRLTDLEAFYANSGVTPLPMIFEHNWNDYFVSVHAISGLWQVQLILFLFSFFCAAMLFIGYRSRLFTFLSWFMLLSLHNRNGLILQGGDDLLRMILFWGMFLPWSARYSCDHILGYKLQMPAGLLTAATIAYVLQICYIYTGSALLKGPEWHTDFTAVYYAFSLDQIAYPSTKLFYSNPDLLKAFTAIAWYFELLIPVLFFIPWKHSFFRTIAVFSIIGFHAFNASMLLIGLFPFIGMATVLGILPAPAMDRFDRLTKGIHEKIRSSFTGFATFMHWIIRWRMPVPLNSTLDSLRTAVLIFLTVFIFDWNFSNLSFVNSKLSDNLRVIGYGLRLDQNWGMFAPGVFKDDGWYVMEGVEKNGRHIDLIRGSEPKFEKPESVVSMFKNDRWRKYSENFIFADNEFMRGYFSNYSKRIWNEEHPDKQIDTLRVYYVGELTKPNYEYSAPNKCLLWECY